MVVKFRKQAIKFLQKASTEDASKIQSMLSRLAASVGEKGIIPFNELDIKKMKGEWEGFYRLRSGKIRVVFTIEVDSANVEVHLIGYRGDIYK